MSSRFTSILPLIVGGIVAIVASLFPASAEALRSAMFLFVLVLGAGTIGPRLVSNLPQALRWVVGGVTLLACHSILQTIWYYAGGLLGPLADGVCLGTSLLLFAGVFFLRPTRPEIDSDDQQKAITTPEAAWTTLAVLAAVAGCIFIVVSSQQAATTRSINGAWILFPAGTFVAVALLYASGFLASLKSRTLIVAGIVAATLLTLASLTIFIYPLGYGFDGFLHRASEAVILESGTLTPAPPSYIGQYTLVTWLTRVLRIPPSIGDVWLVGALALLLPLACVHLASKKRRGLAVLGLLLALPLGILSATTPQNVAYVLGLLALLWLVPTEETSGRGETLPSERAISLAAPWIFLTWSLATHPLAGLPFAFAGFALTIHSLRSTIARRTLIGLSLLGSLLAVPLAFSVRAALQSGGLSWAWVRAVPSSLGWFAQRLAEPATHLALWPDWANWQGYLLTFLLLGAAVLATFKDKGRRSIWLTLIGFALAAGLSSWLLEASGDFSFLISYERQAYAARLLVVMQLFLIPAALVGISYWFERAERAHPRMRAAALLIGLAWFSANVYNMLPRNDAAAIGHGWNVGQSDIEAVKFIEKQANGQSYTVLANQTVSAAAISTLGFKRYVGDIFFYPIPTGGPLYERFLQMMEKPDLDIAKEAGDLGESKLVYVVVNQYWFRAPQLIERLKTISDRTWNVERGAAYIFLFDLSRPSNTSTTRSGA
jgi:hypothetical protein